MGQSIKKSLASTTRLLDENIVLRDEAKLNFEKDISIAIQNSTTLTLNFCLPLFVIFATSIFSSFFISNYVLCFSFGSCRVPFGYGRCGVWCVTMSGVLTGR